MGRARHQALRPTDSTAWRHAPMKESPEKDPGRGPEGPWNTLIDRAIALGAHDAGILPAGDLVIEDRFAAMCSDPRCPGYGQSMSCPPNVMEPGPFREKVREYRRVLVFKFDIPTEILLSSDRHGVYRLLHETAAALEREALAAGCESAFAMAGGSCKTLFCGDHPRCRVLDGGRRVPEPGIGQALHVGAGGECPGHVQPPRLAHADDHAGYEHGRGPHRARCWSGPFSDERPGVERNPSLLSCFLSRCVLLSVQMRFVEGLTQHQKGGRPSLRRTLRGARRVALERRRRVPGPGTTAPFRARSCVCGDSQLRRTEVLSCRLRNEW